MKLKIIAVTMLAAVIAFGSHYPQSSALRKVATNIGDNSVTLTPGVDAEVQIFSTTLTGNRTVTLSTTGAYNGTSFTIVRTGLGLFTLNVGGLKTIASATAASVTVMYDGGSWILIQYSVL